MNGKKLFSTHRETLQMTGVLCLFHITLFFFLACIVLLFGNSPQEKAHTILFYAKTDLAIFIIFGMPFISISIMTDREKHKHG